MRILFLADGTSIHTENWVRYLTSASAEIYLFSLTKVDESRYRNIKSRSLGFELKDTNTDNNDKSKIRYLKAVKQIKLIIKEFKPDIVHAHYATSYGLLGVLANFKPLVISVWGSDVYYFPRKSILHELMLRFNLKHAGAIFSTSRNMARETEKYTRKKIYVTPFGIDTGCFIPKADHTYFSEDYIVIGTIKSLDRIYGIEYLIKAFVILKKRFNNIKLMLVGGHSKDNEEYVKYLNELVDANGIRDDTVFAGRIPHNKISDYHNMLDIPVYVSLRESFGVSVLESESCGKPVIVSDVGGLPEVVQENQTGYIVPAENEIQTAAALEKLIVDKERRNQMGRNAREFVIANYSREAVTNIMMEAYRNVLKTEAR